MPKYVAFLRAINVGGHTVKMDYLRNLFVELGFANVETFIASGNVIFDSRSKNTTRLEQTLEKFLREKLGYEVRTFVRAASELAALAEYQPFNQADLEADDHTLYIGFLETKPTAETTARLLKLSTDSDDFHLNERELFWLCGRLKFSESIVSGGSLEKTLGMKTTLRNSNTIKRIAAKYR
jgi:uncharacterized protein (DUF1697 family)